MKQILKKFTFLYPDYDTRNQIEKCFKKELSYEEVIKRYEELCSK